MHVMAQAVTSCSAYLRQDLPRNDDDLHRLERDVPCHTLDQPSSLSGALPRCRVRHDGDSHDEGHYAQSNRQHDTGRVAQALGTNEPNLCCVPIAADCTVCSITAQQSQPTVMTSEWARNGTGFGEASTGDRRIGVAHERAHVYDASTFAWCE